MNSLLPASSASKPVQKPRLSKRLRQAIVLWLTGKAGTRKDAAAKAKLSETYFCKALKRPAAQSFVREWAEQNIADATLRACSRLRELLDGDSEHVAAKVALRLAENAKLIAPAGASAPVINHFGNGPVGIVVDWKSNRDKSPYTEEERANLRKFMSEVEVERYIAERSVSDASEAVEGGEVVNSENGSDP